MTLVFYPHTDDLMTGPLEDQIDLLTEAAQEYKAVVLGAQEETTFSLSKQVVPREIEAAFNWEGISHVLTRVRVLPEITNQDKLFKAEQLRRLAEVYEVLRAAKMSKLEGVRLALVAEANQLQHQAG